MTTHARFQFLLLLSVWLVATACDKKDNDDTSPQTETCVLTQITFFEDGVSDGSAIAIQYNSKGLAEKLTETEGAPPEVVSTSTLVYNADNQLIRDDFVADGGLFTGYRTLQYNTDGTLRNIDFYIGGKLASSEQFTYDAAKKLTQATEVSGGMSFKKTYQYVGTSENISTITYYDADNKVAGKVTYENYDDKLNILYAVKGLVQPGTSRNNPGKETFAFSGYANEVTTYTYRYNATGFVTEMIEKEEGDATEYKSVYTYTGCK